MEFLFNNPLANLKGPMFLALYVVFIFTVLIAYPIIKSLLDKTSSLLLPTIPQNPDAYEIAYLRGGANEVARSAIFSLRQKGLVNIETVGKQHFIAPTNANKTARLNEIIEQAASGWLKFSREPKEVFSASGLTEILHPYCEKYENNLQQRQLLAGESLRNSTKMLKGLAIVSIFFFGLYKLFAALNHGKSNVLFLIIIGAVGIVAVQFLAKPARITKLGKSYLKQLETAFDRLRTQVQSVKPAQSPTFAGVDPILLSVGIFGSSILAGSIYNDHNEAFQKSQAGSWNGNSDGSGCGSSSCNSSTCSSGGDGGSSCGGGGCGGCGGGCS